MGTQLLYFVWILIPCAFFLWALYAKLEQKSGSVTKQEPGHYIKQGFFLTICVGGAIFIDTYVLKGLYDTLVPTFIPFAMLQILLLPAILVLGAQIFGGSGDQKLKRRRGSASSRKHRK